METGLANHELPYETGSHRGVPIRLGRTLWGSVGGRGAMKLRNV